MIWRGVLKALLAAGGPVLYFAIIGSLIWKAGSDERERKRLALKAPKYTRQNGLSEGEEKQNL